MQSRSRRQAWQRLYKTARWLRRRKDQLAREPLCEACKKCGRVRVAIVAHHVERHNGDEVKLFEGRLESLCKTCHDGDAQRTEHRGYSDRIGLDGYPIDPAHPFNRDARD